MAKFFILHFDYNSLVAILEYVQKREEGTALDYLTVSRRSEPSSRTTLIGEQPNPWELLRPQDVMSRHRGAELRRR